MCLQLKSKIDYGRVLLFRGISFTKITYVGSYEKEFFIYDMTGNNCSEFKYVKVYATRRTIYIRHACVYV